MTASRSRLFVILAGLAFGALFLLYAFLPRATAVDIGAVETGLMQVTVDEEAKTRVHDAYVISAPITGRLLRVDAHPGDPVVEGETIVARMLPTNPPALDVRTEQQARAAIEAASAALALARAEVKKAAADADFTRLDYQRAQGLRAEDAISQVALDRAQRAWRASSAALDTAHAAVAMREADLEHAELLLLSFTEAEQLVRDPAAHSVETIPIRAPVSGQILRILQESESVVAAGAPIMEIGDPLSDLEIVVELLSIDAVKVSPGDRVIVDNWGGDRALHGVVERIEPWGFTKYSALGVEEQRVNAVIRFDDQPDARKALGHGYRVDVSIIVWEDDNALKIPASAVFRIGEEWAVFKIENGRMRQTVIERGRTNGLETQILAGLGEGDRIVLYPGGELEDGAQVKAR